MNPYEQHLRDARQFSNEASNSLSLCDQEISKLQVKADALKPLAEKCEELSKSFVAKQAEFAALEKKLAEVQKAHAAFHKAATSV